MKFTGIRSIGANAVYIMGGRVLTVAASSIYVLALATHLGPVVYGMLVFSQSWCMAFLPLTALGLEGILSKAVGEDREKGRKTVVHSAALRAVASIAIAILCSVLGWLLEPNPEVRQLIAIFSISLIGRALAMWAENTFVAYEASHYIVRQTLIFRTLEVVAGLTILASGGGVIVIAVINAVSWWLQAAFGGLVVFQRFVMVRTVQWIGFELILLLKQGIPICAYALTVSWLQQGPIILFRHSASSDVELGQFALAMQAFGILTLLPLSIMMAALPVLARAVKRRDGKDRLFLEALSRGGVILGGAVGLGGMTVGPWFIGILFGEAYELTGRFLGYLLWLLIPWTLGHVAGINLFIHDRNKVRLVAGVVASLVLTAAVPAFVAILGPGGVVVGAGIALAVWSVILVAALVHTESVDLGFAILRPGFAVITALGATFALMAVNVWLALAVGLTTLAVLMPVLGMLSREERRFISDLAQRLGLPVAR